MKETKLLNLHEIIVDTAISKSFHPEKTLTEVVHIRIEPELKELTERIVKINGLTVSSFLRQCCETLVREYAEG